MAEKNNEQGTLNTEQGDALVKAARETIAHRLGRPVAGPDPAILRDEALRDKRGAFVTLHLAGELRGCIGSLTGYEPLLNNVRHNAENAAFNDHRFPPLTLAELDQVDIEVSVLSEPRPLDYQDSRDLLAKLRPGIDGVIIRHGAASATFLPQVWDQLPQPDSFLAHLCRKAGLAMDAWQHDKLQVSTYQVQYFAESVGL